MKMHILRGRTFLVIAAAVSLVFLMTGITAAEQKSAKQENTLNSLISMLNYDAQMPQGENLVKKQLTEAFDVREDKIRSLRSRRINYGEIAAVFAFADKMPGGISDANISKVTSLLLAKTGWTQIAGNLQVEVEDVADKISDIEKDAHKTIRKAALEAPAEGMGAGGMGDESEGMEKGAGGGTGETGGGTGAY